MKARRMKAVLACTSMFACSGIWAQVVVVQAHNGRLQGTEQSGVASFKGVPCSPSRPLAISASNHRCLPSRGPASVRPAHFQPAACNTKTSHVDLGSSSTCCRDRQAKTVSTSICGRRQISRAGSFLCTVNLFWRIATEIYSLGEFQSLLHHSAR